jgi:methionyl aminopeptidase
MDGTSNIFVIEISRNLDEVPNAERQRLRPGKLSPRRPVPDHIPRPPYVNSRQPPGIASGAEVHDENGIECMRSSGKLAAQVLQYAGTLVKVKLWYFLTSQKDSYLVLYIN